MRQVTILMSWSAAWLHNGEAVTWRQYENADNRLHRTIAEASRNTVLLALFDQLNAIRRAIVWGRLRSQTAVPPEGSSQFCTT